MWSTLLKTNRASNLQKVGSPVHEREVNKTFVNMHDTKNIAECQHRLTGRRPPKCCRIG